MTQSVTWSLVSNLLKTNLQTGISRFIRNYNASNVIYGRRPRALIGEIDINLSKKKLSEIKKTAKAEGSKKDKDLSTIKAASTLVKTLSVTRDNALSIVDKHKNLFDKVAKMTMVGNYYILREADVERSTLRIHMYALANTTADLLQKIQCINDLKLNINEAIPLFLLPLSELKKLTASAKDDRIVTPEFSNRIEYLANKLGCSIEEMCSLVVKSQHLLKFPMERLKDTTELLLDKGMLKENIKKDFNIYKSSIEKITERIDKLKQIGVTPLKPWLVRCSPEMMDKIEERYTERKNLIGPDNDLRSYLISYFNCDGDLIDGLIKRDPKLIKINIINLSKVLDFLCAKGYSIEEIFRQPRILHYNEKTLRNRYDMLKSCDSGRPSIAAITYYSPDTSQSVNKTNQNS